MVLSIAGQLHTKELSQIPYFTQAKIHFKKIKNLNIKDKNVKPLEENKV